MLGQLLGDFVGGFTEHSDKLRKENEDRADRQSALERHTLELIANSPDSHPDDRAAATVGLLTMQPGKQSGFQKWFGKHQESPVMGEVLKMMRQAPGEGARPTPGSLRGSAGQVPGVPGVGMGEQQAQVGMGQPSPPPRVGGPRYYSPGQMHEMEAEGNTRGAINGRIGSAADNGYQLDADAQERIYSPGAQPRQAPDTPVTYQFSDDTVGQGFVGANGYTDQDHHPIAGSGKTVVKVEKLGAPPRPSTAGQGAAGGTTATMSAKQFSARYGYMPQGVGPNDYVHVKETADGKVTALPAQYSPPSSFSFIPTADGVYAGNTKSGAIGPARGGAGVARAVDPASNASGLRATIAQIETIVGRDAKDPVFGTVDQAQAQQIREREARARGYESYAALQAAAGGAQQGTGAFTPKPPPTAGAPPARGAAPAPKAAAPAGRGAAPVKPAAKAQELDETTRRVQEAIRRAESGGR